MFQETPLSSRSLLRIFSVLTACLLVVPSAALGQSSYTWTGGGSDGNFGTGANWGGSAPSSLQSYLNFAGTTNTTVNNNYTAYSSGFQIYFNSGAGSFTLGGNAINFYNYGSGAPTIENDSTNLQTVTLQIDVEGTNTMNFIANAGNLTFSGSSINFDANSLANFTANSGKTITVSDTINNNTNGITVGNSIGSSSGGGTVIFAGTNTYVGNTTINGGTLQLGNGGSTGSIASGNTIFFNVGSGTSASSGTLAINETGSPTISNNLTMNSASDWANIAVASGKTATLSGAITGAGELWTTGSGNLIIAPNSGSASHSASTVISTGTLSLSDFTTSTLGSSGFFIVNGALNYTGSSTSTTRVGNFALQSATSTIGVTNSGTTLTLSNDLGGFSGGALTKTGTGTLALSATNTYSGITQVNSGTLQVDGSLASGSAVTVGGASSSGTPVLSGVGTVNGTVSVTGTGVAGTISPGDGSVIGTLNTGAVTFGSGATWNTYLASPGTANTVTLAGGKANKLAITGNLANSSGEIIAPLAASTGTVGAGAYLIGTYSGTDSNLSSATVNAYGSGSTVLHGVLVDGGAGTTGSTGIYLDEYRLATATAPSSSQALGNVRVGTVLTGTASISNNSANSFSESLQATLASNGTGFTGVTGGNSGTVNYNLATLAAGVQSGSASVVLASTGVGNNANTTLSTTSVALSGAAYDFAKAKYTGGVLAFGNVRTSASVSNQTVAIGNQTITNASYQDLLNVSATTGNAAVTASGFTNLGASASGATTNNLNLSANTSTAGSLASTETLTLVSNANGVSGLSNGTATTVGSPAAITTTGGVYDYANAKYTGGTLAFGNVHQGATVAAQNVAFGNQTVTNASYQDSLNVSATTGNAAVTATGFTGLGASTSGATTNNLSVSVNTSSTGSLASTEALTLVSNANGVSGLSNGTPTVVGSPTAITTTGSVYSGTSTWASSTGGTWGSLSSNFGTNWGANQGSPGLDSSFASSDTATFGTAVTSGTAHVTLDVTGNNPSLKSVTFNDTNSGTSYSIDQGTGSGSLALNGTGSTGNLATVTNSNGANAISAPVILSTSANVNVASGTSLTVSGVISGSGTGLNVVTGTGTTILSNANTYTGSTVVSAGTLYVNGGTHNSSTSSGTGTGAVTVNSGGTLAGSGNIVSSGVTINSGGTVISGPAQTSAPNVTGTGIAFTNTSVALSGTGTGSLSANLTFDLGAGNPTSAGYHTFSNPDTAATTMTLWGTSTLGFTAGSTESVSLVDLTNGLLSLRSGTPYLLASASSDAAYLNLVINSGTVASPILSLSQNDTTQSGYVLGVWSGTGFGYTPITLNQFGSNGVTALSTTQIYQTPTLVLINGNLEVVPEPGTWALMLSGLALLVLWQKRKSS